MIFTIFNDYNNINIEIVFTIRIPTINMNLSVKRYINKTMSVKSLLTAKTNWLSVIKNVSNGKKCLKMRRR